METHKDTQGLVLVLYRGVMGMVGGGKIPSIEQIKRCQWYLFQVLMPQKITYDKSLKQVPLIHTKLAHVMDACSRNL